VELVILYFITFVEEGVCQHLFHSLCLCCHHSHSLDMETQFQKDYKVWLEYDPKDAEIESVGSLENVVIHSSDDNGVLLSYEISIMKKIHWMFVKMYEKKLRLMYTLALVFFFFLLYDVVSIKLYSANCSSTVRFRALTAVVMKSSIFWDIMMSSPARVNYHFWEIYYLHLQVWRVARKETRAMLAARFRLVS
jgi:hypothetical protein